MGKARDYGSQDQGSTVPDALFRQSPRKLAGMLLHPRDPLHSEFGSVGGPHQATRSEHQYSPVSLSKTNRKPTSIKTAEVIASAITKRLLVVVTAAS